MEWLRFFNILIADLRTSVGEAINLRLLLTPPLPSCMGMGIASLFPVLGLLWFRRVMLWYYRKVFERKVAGEDCLVEKVISWEIVVPLPLQGSFDGLTKIVRGAGNGNMLELYQVAEQRDNRNS